MKSWLENPVALQAKKMRDPNPIHYLRAKKMFLVLLVWQLLWQAFKEALQVWQGPICQPCSKLMSKHQDIPAELYGKWQDVMPAGESNSSTHRPSRQDLPRVHLSSTSSIKNPQTVWARAGAVGDMVKACYRWAQTFKHPNIKVFKHLGVLGQTWFLLRI
jgi:hypothetical protein